ncbi:BatD family protein [Vibrio mediterranei]|uniref:BatD family protein n=1 Tax=Vibrio mediterranei TaxID=689 RepID=UPI00148B3E57|nr:BatD family protein [Vibrio mediterranei]NOH28393.1 protein BatD [Vibrio mediterranei]
MIFRLCYVKRLSLLLVSTFLLTFSVQSNAAMTINELERVGGVEIKSWLSKGATASEPAAIREQVILYIEVSTPRWFTGGTRISAFGMPDLIVKQRNQLATNYTERKNGQTWSRQRWEITLYPQQSGEYRLPKVPVRVQVSAPDGTNVQGTLYTKPMSLFTQLPDASFTPNKPWFVASNVKVSEHWQQSSEKLEAGDSLTRKVTITADDTLSILLPPLDSEQSIVGTKSYPKPSVLTDSQTRGNYQSTRTDETVYILTTGGEVTFPKQTIRWWDSESQSVKEVTLATKKITVAHTWRSLLNTYWSQIAILISASIVLIGLTIFVNRYYKLHPKPPWWLFQQAVRRQDWPKVRTLLYLKGRKRTANLELKRMYDSDKWRAESEYIQRHAPNKENSFWLWRQLKSSKQQQRVSDLKGLDKWR